MMYLAEALRAGRDLCLALVGAGGKSRAMFTLARELSPPVFVAASTHLAHDQLSWADDHLVLERAGQLRALGWQSFEGVTLFTGPLAGQGRTAGLSPDLLAALHAWCKESGVPLLMEADGSRQRPLKAPAHHEPALPDWVTEVVVVAGLSGLGKPLSEAWVHRPERFAALSGLVPGQPVRPDALAKVLVDPEGGLKRVPPQARRVALLTQASTDERRGLGARLAKSLLGAYDAILIADLSPNLPPVDRRAAPRPPVAREGEVQAVHERIAGVVLAAGEARRMASPKQVLLWEGEPLVRRVAATAWRAGLSPVVVVTGAHATEVEAVLVDQPVSLARNQDWAAGQSTSVRTGLEALPPEVGAVVFLLADQPQTPAPLLQELMAAHRRTLAPIVAPRIRGRRGNPVLFDRSVFQELMSLEGDAGGRSLFRRYPVAWVPWDDPRQLLDVDTPADFDRLSGWKGG